MAIDVNTLARPYAKAAFKFAKAHNTLPQWSLFLEAGAMVSSDSRVIPILKDPSLSNEQHYQLFNSICDTWLDDKSRNFLKQLAYNKRLRLLPEITALYDALRAEEEKTVEVEVGSFMPLSQDQQTRLSRSLTERLHCQVVLNCHVDETLLGGVVVRAGDLVIDGSVVGQLKKMRYQMVA